jgi:plastocyanin
MSRFLPALLFPLLLLAGAAAPASVTVKGLKFSPATVTINAGESVTWRNADQQDYTVTAKNGGFDSGPLKPGRTFKHTFNQAGSFPYGSKFHPRMSGTVVVK